MENNYDCDLLIIGAGSAGATAAMTAATDFGKKVILVERGPLGGTCTNVGCVPSKSYLHAARLLREAHWAKSYGLIREDNAANLQTIQNHKQKITNNMRESGEKALQRAGVNIIHGNAKFAGPNEVSVGGKTISAKNILVAAGASPFIPPIKGLEDVDYMTSVEALELEERPESIIIVGGAYIGLELATFFYSLGAKTTVIEVLPRLAPNEDAEISEHLTDSLVKQGINCLPNAIVESVSKSSGGITVEVNINGENKSFEGEKLLIATGRIPDLGSLSLDAAGIKYGRKGIEVSPYLQTSTPSVYAAGDLIPSLQLEHVAVYEGWLAVNNIYSDKKVTADYRVIPRVMFCYPEVASVGETEEQARKSHDKVETATFPFRGIPSAQINEETEGLIKLVVDAADRTLLGAHIVGNDAGNLIHLASLVMKFNIPVTEIADSLAAYPTLSQGFYSACELVSEKLAA